MKIGEILVHDGLITREQLAQGLRVQGMLDSRLGTTLLEEGLIAEDALLAALGRQRATRTVSSTELAHVPPEVVRMIPARLAERYGIVPFHLKGRTLSVASKDAGDFLKEDEISFLTSCMVKTCIGLEFRIHEALERYYRIRGPERHQALARRLALQARSSSPTDAALGETMPAVPPELQAHSPALAEVPPSLRPPSSTHFAPPVTSPRPASPPATAKPATPMVPAAPAPPTASSIPSSMAASSIAVAAAAPAAAKPAPAAPPAPPRFIELDEEDAALLGVTSSESTTPEADEPVLLEPTPLPWLARKPEGEDTDSTEPAVPPQPPPSVPINEVEAPAISAAPEPPPARQETPILDDTLDLDDRLHQAGARLRDVEIRDDIGDVLLAFCRPHFRRRMILVTRKDHIVGWRGEGEGVAPEKIRTIEIRAQDPSVFLGLTGTGSFWLGSLPTLDANQALVDGLGGNAPTACVVLPVILRSRVVCYLYGDNLGQGVAGAPIAELRRLVAKAGLAFEVYILKNKLRVL